jgi:hypothetical protein
VNSSIAHIHASRRHRLIAARELRILKGETDALRQELNEWRDRSGLPRLEEPARGDGFNVVLNGEVEIILPAIQQDDMDEDGEDDLHHAHSAEDMEEAARAVGVNMIKRSQSPISVPSPPSHQFAHNVPPLSVNQSGVAHAHSHPQQVMGGLQSHQAITQPVHGRQHAAPHHIPANPTIASHQSPVSYENPAMIYDGYHPPQHQFGYNIPQSYTNGQLPPHILAQLATEVEHKTAPGWYNNSTGQLTPPNSSGGQSPVSSPFGGIGGSLSGGFPIAQQPRYIEGGIVGRERSPSIGSRGSPVGGYELVNVARMDNVPRWRNEGLVGAPGPNPTAYSLLM